MTAGIWILGILAIFALDAIYGKIKEGNELLKELNKNIKGIPGWTDPEKDEPIDVLHLSGHLPK